MDNNGNILLTYGAGFVLGAFLGSHFVTGLVLICVVVVLVQNVDSKFVEQKMTKNFRLSNNQRHL